VLDGLRGLAILPVVVYHSVHLHPYSLGGRLAMAFPAAGWAGVDLFFVLSGFLITRILVRERGSENYFQAFYARRILRIFPLYFALVFVVLVGLPLLGESRQFWSKLGSHEPLWYWIFLGNFYDGGAGLWHNTLFNPSWSLCVEEHFYLAWPLLVFRLRTSTMRSLCVGLLIGSFGLRCAALALHVNALAVYVMTPMRMDGLAVGSWIALSARSPGDFAQLAARSKRLLPLLGGLFVGLVLLLQVFPEALGNHSGELPIHPLMQTAGFLILAVFFGRLLVAAMSSAPGSWLRRLCEARALRVIGGYSYAIYLLHVPFEIAVRYWVLPAPPTDTLALVADQLLRVALVLGLSFIAASWTWRLIEAPALRQRARFRFR